MQSYTGRARGRSGGAAIRLSARAAAISLATVGLTAPDPALAEQTAAASGPRAADLSKALSPEDPSEVEVLVTAPIPGAPGQQALVYRLYGAKRWEREQRRTGSLNRTLAEIERAEQACWDEPNASWQADACALDASPDPFVGWQRYGVTTFSLHAGVIQTDAKAIRVVATRELWPVAAQSSVLDPPDAELRIADLDADSRPEVLATIKLDVPDCDPFWSDSVAAAFVLDGRGLREQLAMIAEHRGDGGDVVVSTTSTMLGYGAQEVDGDGHPDLVVSGFTKRQDDDPTDGQHGGSSRRAERLGPVSCLYVAASDSYACADARPGHPTRPGIGSDEWSLAETPQAQGSAGGAPAAPAVTGGSQQGGAPVSEGTGTPSASGVSQGAAGTGPPPPPQTGAGPRCRTVVFDSSPPLNVRAGPATAEPVVSTLPNGTELGVVETRGRWIRIESPAAGWVWAANTRRTCDE